MSVPPPPIGLPPPSKNNTSIGTNSNNIKNSLLSAIKAKKPVEQEAPPQDEPNCKINLFACGSGAYGRLALGNTRNQDVFIQCSAPIPLNVKKLATGAGHVLVIADSIKEERTKVYSWGKCHYGQLGHGFLDADRHLPTPISFFNNFNITAIGAGDSFCLAVSDTGIVFSWGCGYYGALGLGNESSFSIPQIVPIDYKEERESAVNVFGGSFHSMVLTDHGNLYVFGCNTSGQLGLGDTFNRITPTYLCSNSTQFNTSNNNNNDNTANESDDQNNDEDDQNNIFQVKWKSVACGAKHTLFLSVEGDLYRAGSEFIQPGCTTFDHFKRPQKIQSLNTKIVQIAAGKRLSMTLDRLGRVYVDNGGIEFTLSQNNDTKNKNKVENVHWDGPNFTLVSFENEDDVEIESIGCGEYHCLAIDKSGGLFSWGCTHFGKLARYGDPNTPRACRFASPATRCISASGGSNHSFLLVEDVT